MCYGKQGLISTSNVAKCRQLIFCFQLFMPKWKMIITFAATATYGGA